MFILHLGVGGWTLSCPVSCCPLYRCPSRPYGNLCFLRAQAVHLWCEAFLWSVSCLPDLSTHMDDPSVCPPILAREVTASTAFLHPTSDILDLITVVHLQPPHGSTFLSDHTALSPQLSGSHDGCPRASLEPLCLFPLCTSPSLFSLDSLVHCFSHSDFNCKSPCSSVSSRALVPSCCFGEKSPNPSWGLLDPSASACFLLLLHMASLLPISSGLCFHLFYLLRIGMRFSTSGLLNTPGPGAGVQFSSPPAAWLPWGIFPSVPHSIDEGLTLLILMASCASLHESIHDYTLLNVINEWLYLCVDSEHKGSREVCISVKPWQYNTVPSTWGRI